MTAITFFDQFTNNLLSAAHDFTGGVFKIMLTDVAPNSNDSYTYQITEIAAGNGYTAGGNTLDVTKSQTGAVTTIFFADSTFTAVGGTIAQFRYGIIYNAASPYRLVGYIDYGDEVLITDTNSFKFNFNGTDGVLVL